MNIYPSNCQYNSYNKSTPSFKAIAVDKIKPVYITENVNFLNNQTAMLKKSCPFFDGIRKLYNDIVNNHVIFRSNVVDWLYIDDIERLSNILQKLPKENFKNRKLLGLIGTGVNSIAFKLDKKEVLCVSDSIKFLKDRKVENFDLPFLKIGKLKNDKKCGWYIRKYGKPVNENELKKLALKIKLSGYNLIDWNCNQACKVNDKLYLLDFACAVKDVLY